MRTVLKWILKYNYWLLATGIVFMLGLIFANTMGTEEPEVAEEVFLEVPVPEEGVLYILSLGTFEDGEEVVAVEGALRIRDLPLGIVTENGEYHLFTQIVSQPAEADAAKELLEAANLDFTLLTLEPDLASDPNWQLFYDAVNGQAFTLDEEFVDQFTGDEMEIWGYFLTLSRGNLELASPGRQQMLLEIFQWLSEGDDMLELDED